MRPCWVAAENADGGAGVLHVLKEGGVFRRVDGTFHVGEEDIVPARALHGARFQLCHVDMVLGEDIQHGGEGADFVGNGEEQVESGKIQIKRKDE